MKLVVLWLVAVVLALAAAGSCSVTHRSNDFACENTRDCAAGRVCVDGFCIAGQPQQPPPDARVELDARPPVDAPIILPPDAPQCPAQCTSCDLKAKTCKVDCAVSPELCMAGAPPIVCPDGFTCDIDCSTERACRNGIDCTGGAGCTITCGADTSCRNLSCGAAPCRIDCPGFDSCTNVDCGTGQCNVECSGSGSCTNVDCSNACSCDVFCDFFADCTTTCPSLQCSDGNGGCSSQQQDCNRCPPGAL